MADGARGVRRSDLNIVAGRLEEFMDGSIAAKFASSIELYRTFLNVQFIIRNEGAKELYGGSLLASDGNFDTATLEVGNENITQLTISPRMDGVGTQFNTMEQTITS